MKKYILTLFMIFVSCSCSHAAYTAAVVPPRVFSGTVISAYQQPYAMNFEVWKPADLPAGWYVTFDGFPVAQIAVNRWVYGQLGPDGAIRPTDVLVGSVIPSSVPGFVRVAAAWDSNGAFHTPEYMKIRDSRIDRMGWLCDEGMNTIIAWHTAKPFIWVWLGNRWLKLEPNSGEYVWQMFSRWKGYIIDELSKHRAWFYFSGEPFEAADLARQWGYIWAGRVVLRSLRNFKGDGGGGTVTSLRDNSGGGGPSDTPDSSKNNHGQWDVD